MALFTNKMDGCACLLLCCLYYDDMACYLLSILQKFLNFYEIKVIPTTETTLLGSFYSENIIMHIFVRLSALNPSTCLTYINLLWYPTIQR